ncbi:polysaccharide pyruvyl transferase family protein [Pseudochelatococcus sp. B33]
MKTLFLGSYGFGNLGDELCLLDAINKFPSDEVHVLSSRSAFTGRFVEAASFIGNYNQARLLRPERIVLGGGGVGTLSMLPKFMTFMNDALAWGAQCHIYNIGVANLNTSWITPEIRRAAQALASFSVRDFTSQRIVNRWKLDLPVEVTLTRYPERFHPMDDSVDFGLPAGPKLGISLTNQATMARAADENAPLIRDFLKPYEDYALVPVVSTIHQYEKAEDDAAAFSSFVSRLGLRQKVVLPQTLDPSWWLEEMSPGRLKALIAELDVLVSQRKHNCVHAFGAGTVAIGLYPGQDDSLPRLFNTVSQETPTGSRLFPLTML